MRLSAFWRAVPLLGLAGLPSSARAQLVDTYLPVNVPGFDQDRGVTVLSRQRPLYQEQGVRLGGFTVRSGLDETFGYNSNITGTPTGPGSAFLETNPSVSAESNWSRNRLGISATGDRFDYFSASRQSHTDWTVAIGGGVTILKNTLDVGYSHVHGNEFGINAGAVAYDNPVPFDVDIVRGAYTYERGRVTLTPNFDFRLYQYGNGEFAGQTITQRFRDRTVASGGVTTRYLLSNERALVLVVQGSGSNYLNRQPGLPTNNSQSVLILPGIDYQATGPWRYRVLVGGEYRRFDAAQYGSRLSPIFEASVIYTPTELTTLTATLRRAVEDPEAEGTSGYTSTGVSLRADHELRRNVLLQATASYRSVNYFQSLGSTNAYSFGGGVTWLIDPHLSAFASYRYTRQDGSSTRPAVLTLGGPASVLPSFTQNLALVGLRWRL